MKSKKLILGSPEAFLTFSKENSFGKISSLPSELLKVLEKNKEFTSLKICVGVHSACSLDDDPFYNSTIELLKLIPGVKIINLENKCNHKGFDHIDSDLKKSSDKIVNEAVKLGVEVIVCTSPYCESRLLMCQRKGSWRASDVLITDVYRLLMLSLQGGDL